MMDFDAASEPKRPTVAASANQCLESFQQCLLRASSVHPRELSMVEDQVARFSTWTTGIGVFAFARASMDHRLRYAPEVQSVVTGLLESLNYRIRTCSDILDVLGKSPATDAPSVPNEALERSFGDIATEISRLNKISNTIRRASREAQILKGSNFEIKDEDGNDVESLLLGHFEHHIRDRFPNISDTIQQRLARAMLLRRKQILHRRHRQGNTAIRPQKVVSKASITLPAAPPTVPSAQGNPHQDDGQVAAMAATTIAPSQIKSATTLAPDKFKMAASSPSVISASKTVALGNHEALNFPPAPGLAAKRKYEHFKLQRLADHQAALDELNELYATMVSYKDPPLSLSAVNRVAEEIASAEAKLKDTLKSDLQAIGEITCPYCLYALPAEEVFDERKWQNHVKNDLDPYVCLFEDCDQPDELYSHSDGWLSHLHQHGQRWRCSSHRELGPFSTRGEYIQHMREAHHTKLSDTQLRVLANRNTRKIAKLFSSCPLCGKDEAEVDRRLEDHVAGHLRSLALKSLPSYQDEIPDDAGSGKDSVDASRPQSRSTVKNLGDDENVLAFGTEHFWDHWKPQLTETKPTNFLGDAHLELDLSHTDAWMASWNFDKLASRKSLWSLEDDPIIQSMLQRKKDRTKAVDDRGKNSSDLQANQEAGDLSKAPEDEASGLREIPSLTRTGATDDPEEAIRLARQAVQSTPDNYPSALASMANLASTYKNQGRWEEAVKLLEQVVAIEARTLAEDHPDRLASQHALASAYRANGQVPAAVALLEQVVAIRTRTLAEDHPDRLASQHALASAYRANGQVPAAVALLEQVVAIRERVLAEDHPSRLASQHELASAYEANGQVAAAVALLEQVVAIGTRTLAEDHPDRLASQHALASAYRANGQVPAAVALLEQVVAIRTRTLAEDHPDRLASQHALAIAYRADGQVPAAVALLEQVVAIRKRVLAEDHPSRLASQHALAYMLQTSSPE